MVAAGSNDGAQKTCFGAGASAPSNSPASVNAHRVGASGSVREKLRRGTMLEGPADGGPVRRLDAIAKDVVSNAPVVAAPRHDS